MIRPLRPGDAPAVGALLTEALGGVHAADALVEDPPHTLRRVLVEGEAVLGFAEYRVIADEAELCEIAVAPAARRRGFGRALVEHVAADAAARGAEALYLEVRADNAPARSLYAAAGFEPVGARRGYYADGADAALYRRALATPKPSGAAS